jgi:transposase-like protein
LIVTGVRDDGKREVIDPSLADTESEATYSELF